MKLFNCLARDFHLELFAFKPLQIKHAPDVVRGKRKKRNHLRGSVKAFATHKVTGRLMQKAKSSEKQLNAKKLLSK